MAATRRLQKELSEIRRNQHKEIFEVNAQPDNVLKWTCLLKPAEVPYSKGAFRIKIDFPTEYPFKPPKITFQTRIYHPNVDEKGQVCLPIVSPENWKPATKTDQVLEALIELVKQPEPEHPLRADLAEEFTKDKKKFIKNAEEHTKNNSLKRD